MLAFGASAFSDHPAPLDELAGAFGRSVVAGCSTAGEILGNVVGDDSLVVAIARFAEADLALASAAIPSMDDSAAAGEQLGRQLAPRAPRAVLVFSAGVAVNGSELVRGLVSTLPAGTVVAGGLAGDGDRFERTWVLVDGQPRAGYVTAVALCGPVDIATGSRGGWDAFGPERRITRSRGQRALRARRQAGAGALQGLPRRSRRRSARRPRCCSRWRSGRTTATTACWCAPCSPSTRRRSR